MANHEAPAQGIPGVPRDRPWLLPANRKLRNLLSISIRNLENPHAHGSPRGLRRRLSGRATSDDDALPQTRHSPAKIVALREQRNLGHSRSSNDLRAWAEEAVTEDSDSRPSTPGNKDVHAVSNEQKEQQFNGSPRAGKAKHRSHASTSAIPRRPEFKRMRRRSTLEWAKSSPLKRQERLEDVIHERLVDVFYSLHVQGIEDPVHVSEVIEQTMNPTFGSVDWSSCGSGITRLAQLGLKVWTRRGKKHVWKLAIQAHIDLRGLQYVGRNLESVHRRLAANAILLQLPDGIYLATTSISDLVHPAPMQNESRPSTSASQSRRTATSAFDALLRLSRLDDSIQDALATRDKIAADLEALLLTHQDTLVERDEVAEAQDRLKTIDFAKLTVQKQLSKARRQQEEKRSALATRRKLMLEDREQRRQQLASLTSDPKTADTDADNRPNMRASTSELASSIKAQRRRICEELQKCYPIEPSSAIANKPLAFTIRDIYLPNSEDLDTSETNPDRLAAALGYVAHILQLLSFYLDQPLPYPVTVQGSTSTIYDGISILKAQGSTSVAGASVGLSAWSAFSKNPTSDTPSPAAIAAAHAADVKLRTYPLFSTRVPRFRFEYGVFLLNQNLRVLLENCFSVRVLDIRQTLPNLKYLLYLATVGEGEIPGRKAGGIRGLAAGYFSGMRNAGLERRGSADSNASSITGGGWNLGLGTWGAGNGNGNPATRGKSARERLREIEAAGGASGKR